MRSIHFICYILIVIFCFSCSKDTPDFDPDPKPPVNPHDRSQYAKYATNTLSYGLKGKITHYEKTFYEMSEWDDKNEIIRKGIPRSKYLSKFDENGVLTSTTNYKNFEGKLLLYTHVGYEYDSIYRVIHYEIFEYVYDSDYKNIIDSISVFKQIAEYDDINKKATIDFRRQVMNDNWEDCIFISELDAMGRIPSFDFTNNEIYQVRNSDTFQTQTDSENEEIRYERNYRTISEYDSKGNVVESFNLSYQGYPSEINNEYTFVGSHEKMNITYADGPATGNTTSKSEYAIDPLYKAAFLTDSNINLKGAVLSVTNDEYKLTAYTEEEDTSLNNLIERFIYIFDKNGVNIKKETWKPRLDHLTGEITIYLALIEEYLYDNKLRKTSIIRKKPEQYDSSGELISLNREEIIYDDKINKATHLKYQIYRDDYERLEDKYIHNLNEDGFIVKDNYTSLWTNRSTSSTNNSNNTVKDREIVYIDLKEDFDQYGNWIKRIHSQTYYNSSHEFKYKQYFSFTLRTITYY